MSYRCKSCGVQVSNYIQKRRTIEYRQVEIDGETVRQIKQEIDACPSCYKAWEAAQPPAPPKTRRRKRVREEEAEREDRGELMEEDYE